MSTKLYSFLIFLVSVFGFGSLSAQTAYSGLTIASASSTIELADSLYIGPGTYQVDGTWEIYSSYVIIEPTATFTGSGLIQFQNPGLWTGVSGPTHLDGNNLSASIDVNVQNLNDAGLQLTELPFPSDLTTTFGWTQNTASSTVYLGLDLDLAVDGADITLGTGVVGDLRFGPSGTISGYRPQRMVITNNSILSHVVKESYTSAFTFPVGIADGDYTPAQISNVSNNTVHVSVQDYAASASPEVLTDGAINLADGMNRTWHIYADNSGISSTLNLQHNSSSNQSGFSDATHFVTQWGTTTPNTTGDRTVAFSMSSWQTNIQAAGALGSLSTAGTVPGSSMRSRTYSGGLATTSGANQSYFTKSADSEHPLPITLVSFDAQSKDCDVLLTWKVGSESKLSGYQIQHSTDGSLYQKIAELLPRGANSTYTYLHQHAANGINLYRLVSVEMDGKYTVSKTIQISKVCDVDKTPVTVYASAVNSLLYIKSMGSGSQSTIRILNMHGQTLIEKGSTDDSETIDISELPSAPYLVQVIQNAQIVSNTKVFKN